MYGMILLLHIPGVLNCYGEVSSEEHWWLQITTTVAPSKGGDIVDRNLQVGFGGFVPSKEEEKRWRDWLIRYKEKQKEEKSGGAGGGTGGGGGVGGGADGEMGDGNSTYQKERGPGSGWPSSWVGFGPGSSGAEPPPWAYVPVNTGLPSFCYQPLLKGTCQGNQKRWAFNPFTAECVDFTYTGCGGNQNNFFSRLKCEQSCMKTPMEGCDPKTKQFVDYMPT